LLPFIEDMGAALGQADLVVSRAGAMTVAELAAVGVGAVLVPFPHAVDDHQTANARFLVEGGAAQILPQSELSPQHLADLLRRFDRARCRKMALAARALARPEAAETLAEELERLAKETK
jgi:UDP-N-acetylglucosamine--N-acetylmuramyl-(pentapeptide) pyrophosphoryl-undecaprenol N-acetylglucosamine transferase